MGGVAVVVILGLHTTAAVFLMRAEEWSHLVELLTPWVQIVTALLGLAAGAGLGFAVAARNDHAARVLVRIQGTLDEEPRDDANVIARIEQLVGRREPPQDPGSPSV